MAKQPADLDSLGTALFCAREMAEELDEVVVLYFIEMAIAEAKAKSPPTANDHQPRTRNKSRVSRKKNDMSYRSGAPSRSSSGLASSKLVRDLSHELDNSGA